MSLKKYKFNELYTMSSGLTSKLEQAGYGSDFISFSTIFNNPILPKVLLDKMNTTLAEQETYSVKKGDILITRTSETLDELAMSSVAVKDYENVTFSGFAKRLRPTKYNVDNHITYDKYMAFYLRSAYFRKLINNNAIMTLRASFNEQIFSYLYLLLPDYDIQIKIGDMLYSIYEQIERNNAMVQKLQVLGNTIYSKIMTSFKTPKLLGDLVEMYQPETITSDKFVVNGDYPVYGAGGIIGFYNKYNHEEPQLMVSCRGICGKAELSLPKSFIIGNQMVIKPKNKKIKYFLYNYLLNCDLSCIETGSVQKQITRTNLEKLQILLPNEDVISEYYNIFENVYTQKTKIILETERLINLKEKLLPLLINGQLNI